MVEGDIEAFEETIWMMPPWKAPLVMFTSPIIIVINFSIAGQEGFKPSGCPSFARAAALTKMGMDDGNPRRVVEGSHFDTGRMIRALKKNRPNARVFSAQAKFLYMRSDNKDYMIQLTYFIVCGRRIISKGSVGHNVSGDILEPRLITYFRILELETYFHVRQI